MRLATIGVYGFDARSFFLELERAGVDIIIDVRRRRAVRGPVYAFANAKRLTARLNAIGIAYRHVLDLAPSNAMREIVYEADRRAGRKASERTELPAEYVRQYRSRVVRHFDFTELAGELRGYDAPALLCVEGTPGACHRSLAAPELAGALGIKRITHLIPG